jgi:hypothetical protein
MLVAPPQEENGYGEASEMVGRIFLMLLAAMAVRSNGWMDGIGMSDDAFWCWEEDAKDLGSIGWV